MGKHPFPFFLLYVAAFSMLGCTEDARKRLESRAIAVGTLNQLAIVMDGELWDGALGDSINYYFGSAYPVLPQPEPLFDLKHFTAEDLDTERVRRELKAYLIVGDLSDKESPTTKLIGRDIGEERGYRAQTDSAYRSSLTHDRWASNQIVIYLFAPNLAALAGAVVDRFPAIAQQVQDHYKTQVRATVYQSGDNRPIMDQLSSLFECQMRIPKDFVIAMEDENTVWLKREREMTVSNLLITSVKYEDANQFEKEYLIALRDTLGRNYISSSIDGSYMKTNPVDLPVLSQSVQIGGAYAREARGIWEMEGDYLGGPFVSYLIHDNAKGRLLFVDAFVLAPGERKRNLMIYLEHIVSTVRFIP